MRLDEPPPVLASVLQLETGGEDLLHGRWRKRQIARGRLREVAEQATSGFSERELATFVAFLRRVVSNLDQASED